MAYRVKVQNFEGPLDLLLFLIKKNEVDVNDIPISDITKQYLDYVEIIKMLDLESASEFILLAATLLRIKAKMLLPRPPVDDDDDDIVDPRLELVTRLLEYKQYKELASRFLEFEEKRSNIFARSYYHEIEADSEQDFELGKDINVFSLIDAFKHVVDRMPKITYHQVENVEISLDEQIDYVIRMLQKSKQISFYDLILSLKNKIIIVVTFIALLELMKRGEIFIRQSAPFGEIWIARKSDRT